MTLHFTLTEMIKALEAIGYTITFDEEYEYISHPGHEEKRPFKVYNCWYRGECMTTEELGFGRLGGSARIERVFKYELQKKLLNLFM